MSITCNIDARGKRARLISGIAQLVLAFAIAALWAWPSGNWYAWTLAAIFAAGGAFTVFEARAGWCALRAMGMKTRI